MKAVEPEAEKLVMALQGHSTSKHASAATIASDEISRCLWINLSIGGPGPATPGHPDPQAEHNILLTVSFGLGRLPVLGGTVDFGINEAELHVQAVGSSIPPNSRWPKETLQAEAVVRRTEGQGHKDMRNVGTHAVADAGEKGVTAKISKDHERGHEQRQDTKDEFDLLVRGITSSGSPTKPIWRFRALPGHVHLAGQLDGQVIGRLVVDNTDSRAAIDAHCEIMKRFVRITDSDGFLANLATNSRLVVLRSLVRKAIFNQIKKYLRPIRLEAGSDG